MKPLTLTLLFFFLFFTFSHSQRLEFLDLSQNLFSINPDHHQGSTVDRATQDDILLSDLITKSSQVQPVEVKGETENKQALDVTRFDLRYFGKSRKFPFSRTFRFFPRRCHHNKPDRRFVQWAPASEMDQNVVQFMYKKEDNKEKDRVVPRGIDGPHSEILQHRHVARKFKEAGEMMMINRPHFIGQIPRPHHHHHDHHHDHDHDEKEEEDKHDEKEISDDQKEHHHDHDGVKEGRNEVINKIRKFLNYF